jgi:alkylation response protein AidB-like acyl-CoA dehydrogenase
MDFSFNDEQKMIREMVQDFAQGEIVPLLAKYEHDDYHIPPEEMLTLWKKMGELGLIGVALPQEYGGLEDCVSQAIILEEIGRASGGIGWAFAIHLFFSQYINIFGTEEQKQKYLPLICSGQKIASVAFTEPDTGSDPKSIKTTAVLDGDEYVINGIKRFITLSNIEGPIIIIAKDSETEGGKQLSAFIADKHTPGYSISSPWRKIGMHEPATCDIFFDNMRIPASNLLGKHGQGFQALLDSMEANNLNHTSVMLGMSQSVFDESVKYAKERMVKGRPITQFQTIQTHLADITVGLEVSRAQLYRLAAVMSAAQDEKEMLIQSRVTRIFLSETLNEIARKALKVHGCYGYTDEFRISKITRDALFSELIEVVNDIQKIVLAGLVLK